MQKNFCFETLVKGRRGGVGNMERVVKSQAISFQ